MINFRTPVSLLPEELDLYLAHGWYRMGQRIFTVDYIFIKEWIRVFWLRFRMKEYSFGKKQKQILSRCSRFQVSVLPLRVTEEVENLYGIYRRSIDFEASQTASELLFDQVFTGEVLPNVYNSRMIQVRDGGRLIAVGVFDLGIDSMAGIVNFYDPEYRKYSLGKFLILQKMEYAQSQHLTWYYPGYIGYKLTKFDYKLDPGTEMAEILEPFAGLWLPYQEGLVEQLALSQEAFFFPVPEEDEDDEMEGEITRMM